MSSQTLLRGITFLIPLILSLSIHEWAHAWSAYRLGDDTASRQGRMTLNPIAHIDPIGTLLLPLLAIMSPAIPFFGWAKPVPVDPTRFSRKISMTTGMMITALAGPVSNILQATIATVAYGLLARFSPALIAPGGGLGELLQILIQINVVLAIFNLLPVPPLDGSRIVDGLLPYRLRDQWHSFSRLSPLLLIGIFFAAPRILPGPTQAVMGLLQRLLVVIASPAG
jgi:Zn-dependent protease